MQMASGVVQNHPHILLIEDEEFILDLLSMKFREEPYCFSIAKDTEAAALILGKEKIDLILLDIRLPGKDGFTFLSELKSDPVHKTIPVIILSNLGQKEEQERGLRLGAIDYLIKANVSLTEILERVKRFFAESKKEN